MKPHVHAEIIKAWADGYPIQFRTGLDAEWRDVQNHSTPAFNTFQEYRIKPQPTVSTQEYHVYQQQLHLLPTFTKAYPPNLRLVFENGKLVGAELIDGR